MKRLLVSQPNKDIVDVQLVFFQTFISVPTMGLLTETAIDISSPKFRDLKMKMNSDFLLITKGNLTALVPSANIKVALCK